MNKLLDHVFGIAEEINGGHRCPTYLFRWTLLRMPWGKIYLHKFVGDDWSLDLHDHPKRFISIGLWGRYREETDDRYQPHKLFMAPWVRSFPAVHRHRISLCDDRKPCWTLVFVGKTEREWGFWHNANFIPWLDYVRGKGGIADKMKACD